MPTLTFRLSAPMQSWGTSVAAAGLIGTQAQPTKSGIVGLLAAALGRPRGSDVSDLTSLRTAVRTERAGVLVSDYHTATFPEKGTADPLAPWEAPQGNNTHLSTRDYLADAVFLVGIEAEDEGTLRRLKDALIRPVWPLYLGRRCCVADPLYPELHEADLDTVMRDHPWTGHLDWEPGEHDEGHRPDKPLTVMADDERGRRADDVPLDTTRNRRRFGKRRVKRHKVMPPTVAAQTEDRTPEVGEHEFDPMALIEEAAA